MRAVAYDRFGGPEVLHLRDDLPDPPVGPDTVLVRTRATAVNPVDIGIREGQLAGFFPHRFPIVPGWDLAGVVESVGRRLPTSRPATRCSATCAATTSSGGRRPSWSPRRRGASPASRRPRRSPR